MTARAVLCVDGPSGSGKGTLARRLAAELGFAYLDSGAIYRALGLRVQRQGLADAQAAQAAAGMELRFGTQDNEVWMGDEPIASQIRTEEAGAAASRLGARPEVREALLQWQRDFAAPRPLVADGRDMGTVVFPHAPCKIFLEASAQVRAQRRHAELLDAGKSANFDQIYRDICARDERDRNRAVAPLRPAEDALVIDSSALSIDQVVDAARQHWQACQGR